MLIVHWLIIRYHFMNVRVDIMAISFTPLQTYTTHTHTQTQPFIVRD